MFILGEVNVALAKQIIDETRIFSSNEYLLPNHLQGVKSTTFHSDRNIQDNGLNSVASTDDNILITSEESSAIHDSGFFEDVSESVTGNVSQESSNDNERIIPDELFSPEENAFFKQCELEDKRYREWENLISTKLKNNYTDFDIHSYENKIIENCKNAPKVSFLDLVKGKEPSDVAKYFVACLQLANSSNVEICDHKPAALANADMNIKLLSSKRHHETFTNTGSTGNWNA